MFTIRYKFLLLFVTFILVTFSIYADDAHSKSVVTTSKARVILPISIINSDAQGLDFGSIVIGSSDSKVVVSPSATVLPNVSSGNAVILTSVPQTAAKFSVSGETGNTYTITIPERMTIIYGANTLDIDNFICSNGTNGTIGTKDLFYIGADLTVPASATPGSYQGTFNVTVAYN